jgi:hypothetical protein
MRGMANDSPELPPEHWEALRKRDETVLAGLRKALAPLESGKVRLKSGGTVLHDVTDERTEYLRKSIKFYESRLVARKERTKKARTSPQRPFR